jgi:hypothetical protein
MQTQYYFVHLPKCAGTALLKSLSRMGKRRLMIVSKFPQSKRAAQAGLNQQLADRRLRIDDPDLIFGHDVFWGIHQLSNRRVAYATVMRDPVQRWISQYRYMVDCSQDKHSPIHAYASSAVVEAGRVLTMKQCAQRGQWTNMMTNYLAAAVEPNLDSARWGIESSDQLREMAIEFLQKMEFVGFVDSIAEVETTIAGWFGLKPKLKVVNSSKTKVGDDICPETVELIRQINLIDQAVYDHAKIDRV